MASEFDRLIKQADRSVQKMGGLVSLLLALKDKKGAKIEWDFRTSQFVVNGVRIPKKRIIAELSRIDILLANDIQMFNQRLFSGEWTIAVWLFHMRKLIEDGHSILGGLAVGGLAIALRNAVVKRRRERDIKYLGGYAVALRAGFFQRTDVELEASAGTKGTTALRNRTRPVRTPASAFNRSRAYLRSLYITFQTLWHRAHIAAGYTHARRILTPAEHCRDKVTESGILHGCLETAARGWIPILEMPPIGSLVCKQFCKCWMEYRKGAPETEEPPNDNSMETPS